MLDIHLPHKSIRGFSEFLIHLFTITVGLLIAVQIESCVEWRHHLHLAEEARAALRAEIASNLKDLKDLQPGLKAWREQVDADLAAMRRIQDHPNDPAAQHASLTVNSSGITLDDTAWRTAQSTGALAYMPYEEAKRYAAQGVFTGVVPHYEQILALWEDAVNSFAKQEIQLSCTPFGQDHRGAGQRTGGEVRPDEDAPGHRGYAVGNGH